MKVYPGFDETNKYDLLYGSAKLVRWFQSAMPEGFEFRGVVRQQLLVCDKIPFTSHNSAACLIADMIKPDLLGGAIERAVSRLKHYVTNGSEPGLCGVTEFDSAIEV